jgi:hypothetical protein
MSIAKPNLYYIVLLVKIVGRDALTCEKPPSAGLDVGLQLGQITITKLLHLLPAKPVRLFVRDIRVVSRLTNIRGFINAERSRIYKA